VKLKTLPTSALAASLIGLKRKNRSRLYVRPSWERGPNTAVKAIPFALAGPPSGGQTARTKNQCQFQSGDQQQCTNVSLPYGHRRAFVASPVTRANLSRVGVVDLGCGGHPSHVAQVATHPHHTYPVGAPSLVSTRTIANRHCHDLLHQLNTRIMLGMAVVSPVRIKPIAAGNAS